MRIIFQQREGFLFEILGVCSLVLRLVHKVLFSYKIFNQNTVGYCGEIFWRSSDITIIILPSIITKIITSERILEHNEYFLLRYSITKLSFWAITCCTKQFKNY